MKIISTKQIANIFSVPKKRVIEKEKQKIFMDYRERNSLIYSELISFGLEVECRELKVADYLVNNIAIERKTVSDFKSSMINGRIKRQLEEITQYENRLLIIEGIKEQELYSEDNPGIHANSIRGFLLSILLKYRLPVLFTKDEEDTARFIWLLARKKETESSLNVSKKSLNKKERLQFILESFPGIGPKNARKLLEELKTLKKILNSPVEDLKKIIGKKAEVFNLIQEEF